MKIILLAFASLAAAPAALSQTAPLAASAVPAPAQATAQIVPQPAAVLETVAPTNILRAGTEVSLIIREELTTEKKKLRAGQRFQMEVAANVEANGVVVIPVGTPAIGEVTEVRNKGMWGKSGYINARILSMRFGDRTIRLTGTFDDKGVTGTAGVVAAVVLVPVVGFFTTGTSAKIPVGSAVKGFLDEDLTFRPVAAPPQILDVPAAVSTEPAAAAVVAPAATH